MRIVRVPKSAWLSALGIALLVVVLSMVGGSAGISQEEEPDVCAGYEEPDYGYCVQYCVVFDCDSEAPVGDEETCIGLFNKILENTGDIPPCETPPPPEG